MKLFMGMILLEFLLFEKVQGMQREYSKQAIHGAKQISVQKSKKKPPARRRSADDHQFGKKGGRRGPSKSRMSEHDEETRDRRCSLPVIVEAKYIRIAPIKSGRTLIGYADHDQRLVLDSFKQNRIGTLTLSHDQSYCFMNIEEKAFPLGWISLGGWWSAGEKWPFLDSSAYRDPEALYTFYRMRRSVSAEELRVNDKDQGAVGSSECEDIALEFQFACVSPNEELAGTFQETYGFEESVVDQVDDEEEFGFDDV